MDHIFKQFVFECMDTASAGGDGMITTRACDDNGNVEMEAMPWDDPYPYYRSMIPKPEIVNAFPLPEGIIYLDTC